MPEYKELERSLLARMFRAGIIDIMTFKTRAEALGYDPNDVFLMIQLEQSEAVKTVISTDVVSGSWTISAEPKSRVADSPDIDIEGFKYITIYASASSNSQGTYGGNIRLLDTNKEQIEIHTIPFRRGGYEPVSRSESVQFSVSVKPNIKYIHVRVSGDWVGGPAASVSISCTKIEGVKY